MGEFGLMAIKTRRLMEDDYNHRYIFKPKIGGYDSRGNTLQRYLSDNEYEFIKDAVSCDLSHATRGSKIFIMDERYIS